MPLNRRTKSQWSRCCALLIGIGCAASLLAPAAHASRAAPSILQRMQPMRVQIVSNSQPGCEPTCAEWISAEGDIVDSTPAAFRKVLAAAGSRKLPVFVNSGGGSIEAAIAIGHMLRDRKLDVSVTKTDFEICVLGVKGCKLKSRARGKPNSYNAYCASACTLLLAAGERRLVSPWSRVGVHQIVVFKTQYRIRRTYRVTTKVRASGVRETQRRLIREQRFAGKTTPGEVTEKTYRPIEAYLQDLGIAEDLIPLMEATPNTSIHWMTHAELVSTRMATEEQSGDSLLKLASTATGAWPTGEPAPQGVNLQQTIRTHVPAYFQGREVSLGLDLSFDKAAANLAMTVELRRGDEPLPAGGVFATVGFDPDHQANAYGIDTAAAPMSLQARVPVTTFCRLRQSGALQLSLHSVAPSFANLANGQAVSVPVSGISGLPQLLAEACASISTAGN